MNIDDELQDCLDDLNHILFLLSITETKEYWIKARLQTLKRQIKYIIKENGKKE